MKQLCWPTMPALLTLCFIFGMTCEGVGAPPDAAAIKPFREILDRREAAWKKKDADEFCKEMTDSVDRVTSDGTIHLGRQDMVDHLKKEFHTGQYAKSTLKYEVIHQTQIVTGVMLVDAKWVVEGLRVEKTDSSVTAHGLSTFVFIKDAKGKWIISAIRSGRSKTVDPDE